MNYELFKELKNIDRDLLTSFFDSYIMETDYFQCSKNNLISLKEYLLELKYMKRVFDTNTKDILASIKEKNKDIIAIEPFFNLESSNDFIIFNQDNFVISTEYSYHIEDELSQLSNIVSKFNYTKEKNGFVSASKNFIINPVCFSIIRVFMKDKTLLAELQLHNNDYDVIDFNEKYLKNYTRENVKKLYFDK